LIALANLSNSEYRLVAVANRDEFYERPSSRAEFWPDAPDILAGRDLRSGGTWFGASRRGRFAAVTNYRDGRSGGSTKRTRGELVAEFLRRAQPPADYLGEVAARASQYDGFNLVVGDSLTLGYLSNRSTGGAPVTLHEGVFGLSNHLLDTPWPKVRRARDLLRDAMQQTLDPTALLAAFGDARGATDQELPATGVSLEWERALAPMFIATPNYGTRCTTVLLWRQDGSVRFIERSYVGSAAEYTDRSFEFQVAETLHA
jgi:uncharacterized protein with NRDE domain